MAEQSDGPEWVVLVRDAGTQWVTRMLGTIRASGARAGLVTGPLSDHDRAPFDEVADGVAVVSDPGDPATVAAAARELAAGGGLAAVFSIADGCVAPAARAAAEAGLTRTPAEPVVTSRDKAATRHVLAAAGLPVPPFAVMADVADVPRVADTVGFPAVVKPLCGTGSHLVTAVADVDALAAAYRRTVAGLEAGPLAHLYRAPHAGADPRTAVLVEGALHGPEYCVDVVVRDGVAQQLALLDKFLTDDRFFELGFVSPPLDLSPERAQAVRSAAGDAVAALGLDNTMAHVEVIDDAARGPTVVEVNGGRPGGHGSTLLNTLQTGVDPTAELVAVLRGVPSPRPASALTAPLAALKFFPPQYGRVTAVHGLAELEAHPDVVTVVTGAEPGTVVTGDHEAHAVGVVVAGFLDRDDLRATYQELAVRVGLEVEPPGA